ncbi:DUF5590 domain-containing protein [Priestia koreensis]|uniref:Uncharacterized protein n=1 Tax=Priestia koreensis TaxID=284581 RepID=A0A0M0LHV3_9BACI|nr:DUF5590 domain-containing protein [Priestia koreensis]KOO50639.1 hypothetical protein AMD01_02515 [Priestia koreensis]MCM3003220.1 DUF5590 domain-containing protein [Priestia koreensis]UNL86022.1 DUF5590 domain-containing protein [Priestia koreensis]
MKKWIISVVALLLIFLIWQSVSVYNHTFKTQEKVESKMEKTVKEKANLKSVSSITTYYGDETYYVGRGKTKKNEKVIVWMPKNQKKHDMIVKKVSQGITKKEVKEKVQADKNPEEIKSIRLGVTKDDQTNKEYPAWEVTYVDSENRFTYYYVAFETGKFTKLYRLYQS